ncbi:MULTISPECIES: penicillin-binding protein 2 [unclassified Lactobacillus]|uniref:peptidoglycan D,D-transpeptidase FtsI family protein n=1 Tax=unclassified Lactobacillus TaxID=2620435 RepID=UPI000EFAAF2C|nr:MULTISPECIES: penicillin-binding protein 2 [unclassified Lactobacillus]RMC24177.1 penicillin-binding protein 2 [Lactobacillus sp. ESL0247]RMC28750.1 penicillin-binding protein 2 [Lactobacillus sp. ESL0246]RMC31407.1 penicillin-binding protein 2 [Lactobacillus sp. ESL0245]
MKLTKKNQGTRDAGKQSSTPIRMKIILGIIFVLFATLIAQLAYLQIGYGSRFKAEVQKSSSAVVSSQVPRGVMYDNKGRILVGNRAQNAITYTRSAATTPDDIYRISNALSQYIRINDEQPTKQQVADYYLGNKTNSAKEESKVPKSIRDTQDDKLINQRINEQVLSEKINLTSRQKTAALIYNKISGAYSLSTIYLKNNGLTDKEIAQVGEHLSELPGVGIGTDWQRYYPNGSSIQSIIGSVSTEKAGLPGDNLQYYLTNGYSRNDRVGTSYLEEEYEPLLKGSKSTSMVSTKSAGDIEQTKSIYAGQAGSSLILTLDAQYQKQVQKSLEQIYSSALAAGAARYSNGAYAVAMDPQTGALLAVAGISRDPSKNKMTNNALGVINQSFVMGSAVKGAMVSGGLINKVITPYSNTLPDTPVYLPGTPIKKSVYPVGTFGALDAETALEVSSNIYMMHLAMNWVHAKYVPKEYISMPQTSFDTLRHNFNMFGLGQKTGVDLPGEVAGIQGRSFNEQGQILSGSVLDLAYGNYDAYTPIQMVQYVATIANGGYRMQPYIVQSIGRTANNGKKVHIDYNKKPNVQLRIPWTSDELNIVRQGFWRVVHGTNSWGTAHRLKDVKPAISGKSGTAQTFYYDPDHPNQKNPPELVNATFVGYAPSDNAKIATAVIFPGLDPELEGSYTLQMTKAMVQDYFKLHKK